jgi:hypothetical protein
MALHDEIRKDIQAGIIPRRFRALDLMTRPDPVQRGRFLVGDLSYKKRSLVVIPANGSVREDGSQGDYVQRGRQPAYVRVRRGLYRLF